MSNLIAIVGSTGEGKSTSIRTLKPEETFIINVAGKDLPFRGSKKNYQQFDPKVGTGNVYNTSNVESIVKILKYVSSKRPEIRTLVIDDAQYIMSFEAMDRAKEKGYDRHVDIASNYYTVLKEAKNLRDDLNVVLTTHADDTEDSFGTITKRKIKTTGKMLDKFITIEGLFTYVLFTEKIISEEDDVTSTRYTFRTNDPTSVTTAKTPLGCFDEVNIDNDLQYVIDKIAEYNEG